MYRDDDKRAAYACARGIVAMTDDDTPELEWVMQELRRRGWDLTQNDMRDVAAKAMRVERGVRRARTHDQHS